MRFLAVFLFLFSTAALAGDVKLVCNVSGKYFDGKKTQEYKFIFNDSEERICTGYPCKRSNTYKASETISYVGYGNRENANTVTTWSKDIIELRNYDGQVTIRRTLDRTSGTLRHIFEDRDSKIEIDMKGPCKVVRKFENETERKF
ncbi:hypothetical protein [Microbulbifer sp. TYP-18]|uniref:hypothetical protein n=1 Tax=Microbulbifer sp. TYP-18 TaxID=3230024 RepID=UPI0034C689EE